MYNLVLGGESFGEYCIAFSLSTGVLAECFRAQKIIKLLAKGEEINSVSWLGC